MNRIQRRFGGLVLALAALLSSPARADDRAVLIDPDIAAVDVTGALVPMDPAEAPSAEGVWYALRLHNSLADPVSMSIVLDTDEPGQGSLLESPSAAELIQIVTTDEGAGVEPLRSGFRPAARLTVAAGETATFALQLSEPTARLSAELWNERALADFERNSAIVAGLILGLMLAVTAYLSALWYLRRELLVGEAAVFAIAAFATVVTQLGVIGPFDAAGALNHGSLGLGMATITAALALRFARGAAHAVHEDDNTALSIADYSPWIVAAIGLLAGFGVPFAAGAARVAIFGAVTFGAVLLFVRAQRGDVEARRLVWAAVLALIALVTAGLAYIGIGSGRASQLAAMGFLVACLLVIAFWAANASHDILMGKVDALERDPGAMPLAPPRPNPAHDDLRPAPPQDVDEPRYALALAAAHQGVWDWDIKREKLSLSPSIEGALGIRPNSLSKGERDWARLIHPDDLATWQGAVAEYRRAGDISFCLEFRVRAADGHFRWVQLRASMMSDGVEAARCLGVLTDITQQKRQEAELIAAARRDATTGLPNRATLLDAVAGRLKTQSRTALLLIDLDRFKTVNDSLGQAAGDALLAAVAERLTAIVPEGSLIARIGGDEFAIIWPEAEPMGAIDRAEGMLAGLSDPVAIGGRDIFPSASAGLVLIEARHDLAEDVLGEAEIAMFHAKRAGRGQLAVYAPGMRAGSQDLLAIESDLRRALERREIVVHYQPIIDLKDLSVSGFEALMRWRHPSRGLLSADQFVPLAEETGLIVPLGRHVLEVAARELKEWQRFFPLQHPLFVSVNVSNRQLLRPDFLKQVEEILDTAGLAPGTLKIEVTESLVMENPEAAGRVLRRLKAAGAGLAIDDFGVGHSSLQRLNDLPFDTIKIDRSFVAALDEGHGERVTLLEKIISMAHSLGLATVAEGVESTAARDWLAEAGCGYAQGYACGQPEDARRTHEFIASHHRIGDLKQA